MALTPDTLKYMGVARKDSMTLTNDEFGLSGTDRSELTSLVEDAVEYLTAVRMGGSSEFHEDGLIGQTDAFSAYVGLAAKVPEIKEAVGAMEDARNDIKVALDNLGRIVSKYGLELTK